MRGSLYRFLSVIVLSSVLVAGPLHAATIRFIGLPAAGDGRAIQQQIIGLTIKVGPGDELHILNALDRKLIAKIAIPDDPKYARLERRLPLLIKPMRDLKAYTDAMPAAKSNEPNLVHGVSFLDEVGVNAAKYPNQDLRALLLGSAWLPRRVRPHAPTTAALIQATG